LTTSPGRLAESCPGRSRARPTWQELGEPFSAAADSGLGVKPPPRWPGRTSCPNPTA